MANGKPGRDPKREIDNDAILELFEHCEIESLTELSNITGLNLPTLHNWACDDGSPLRNIDICLKLLKTGKTLEELKEMFERAQTKRTKNSRRRQAS